MRGKFYAPSSFSNALDWARLRGGLDWKDHERYRIQCPLPMEGVIDLPYKQIICLPSLSFRNSSFFTLLSETQFFSAYFDLVPNDIVTVWVALDDMRNPAVGPLQYVQKSHLWNDNHSGGTEGFFQKNNHRLDITLNHKNNKGSATGRVHCSRNIRKF